MQSDVTNNTEQDCKRQFVQWETDPYGSICVEVIDFQR